MNVKKNNLVLLFRPECQPILCPPPPIVKNGQLEAVVSSMVQSLPSPPHLYSTVLRLICNNGYLPASPGTEIRCEADGTWIQYASSSTTVGVSILECLPARCLRIQAPASGQVVFEVPSHIVSEVEAVGSSGEEISTPTAFVSAGTLAQFACHEGHQLFGSVSAVCLQNQSWSSVAPQCQSKFLHC